MKSVVLFDKNPAIQDPGLLAGGARIRRVVLGLSLLWVLSAADLYFTLWAHRFTPFTEGNPIASHFLGRNAYLAVVLLKVLTVVVGTVIFWSLRRYARNEQGLAFVVACLLGISVCWLNYTREAQDVSAWQTSVIENSPARTSGPAEPEAVVLIHE